ncbi:hypothetical protein LY16_01144 [Xenorhabdus doucetiae]|nr:hypothetical protein [Xenorhabdus doucetiae]TYP10760.1 hypothetical protein LY16_01144 [Xenorhabdus doucetiae]
MYWDIGRILHERQKRQELGAGIIPKSDRPYFWSKDKKGIDASDGAASSFQHGCAELRLNMTPIKVLNELTPIEAYTGRTLHLLC